MSIYVRKKEIDEEVGLLESYFNSTIQRDPELEYILPRADGSGTVPLTFMKSGIAIDNKIRPYADFECTLFTSNVNYHVNLVVLFKVVADEAQTEDNEEEIKNFSLRLDLNLLSIINNFKIQLTNADLLVEIKDNMRQSVAQILKYGKIQRADNSKAK